MRVGVDRPGRRHAGRLRPARRPIRFYEINPRSATAGREVFQLPGKTAGASMASCWATPGCRWNASRRSISTCWCWMPSAATRFLPIATREAFAVYLRHLAAGGVIAVHITNNYLDLAPVVRAAAADCKLGARRVFVDADKKASGRS